MVKLRDGQVSGGHGTCHPIFGRPGLGIVRFEVLERLGHSRPVGLHQTLIGKTQQGDRLVGREGEIDTRSVLPSRTRGDETLPTLGIFSLGQESEIVFLDQTG